MSRTSSKSPSLASKWRTERWSEYGGLVISDNTRVDVPNTYQSVTAATYQVTPLGHVYRDGVVSGTCGDGLLLRPNKRLVVKLNGGKCSRSLPLMVYEAFGQMVPTDKSVTWRPWVVADAPIDELTGERECSVYTVVLVPHGEIVRYQRSGVMPETIIEIL